MSDKVKSLILLIFPMFFVFFCILRINATHPFFLIAIDPEYAYLFNGLCLADFKFELAHIDHPGTPLQVLISIMIWILYIFQDNTSIAEFTVQNPEMILKYADYALIVLNALALFFLGRMALKKTKMISAGLFLQMFPFLSLITLTTLCRIRPEGLLTLTALTFIILTIKYIYDSKRGASSLKYAVLYAIIMGFGGAVKISFLPFLLIPFFILNNYKQKLIYSTLSIVFFFIFAFPVLNQIVRFWRWATGLFTHSGLYGKGSESIIEFGLFLKNLKLIFSGNFFFSFGLLVLSLLVIYYIFRNTLVKNKIIFRLLTGIWVATILQILIVAKHFKFYYLTPFTSLYIFVFFLIIHFLYEQELIKKTIKKTYIYFIISFFIIVIFIFSFIQSNKTRLAETKHLKTTVQFIDKKDIKQQPLLVVPHFYGGSTGLWALYFGNVWTGKYRFEYYDIMKGLYPNAYIYLPWRPVFHHWGEDIQPMKIREQYDQLYVYFYNDNPKEIQKLVNDYLNHEDFQHYKAEKLYHNENTNESIYLMHEPVRE